MEPTSPTSAALTHFIHKSEGLLSRLELAVSGFDLISKDPSICSDRLNSKGELSFREMLKEECLEEAGHVQQLEADARKLNTLLKKKKIRPIPASLEKQHLAQSAAQIDRNKRSEPLDCKGHKQRFSKVVTRVHQARNDAINRYDALHSEAPWNQRYNECVIL